MLAFRLPQYHKYLSHIPKSTLIISPSHHLLYPTLSPSHSPPNPVVLTVCPTPFLILLMLFSTIFSILYPLLTNRTGHVQFTSSLQLALADASSCSLISITKAILWDGHVSFIYLQT